MSTFLNYEPQKRSSDIYSFLRRRSSSNSDLVQQRHQNYQRPHRPLETRLSIDSITGSITSTSDLSSDSSDDSSDDDDEGFPRTKRRFCEKLEERDRQYEVDHLLRRKSLLLCKQRSLPIQLESQCFSSTSLSCSPPYVTTTRRPSLTSNSGEILPDCAKVPMDPIEESISLAQPSSPVTILQIGKELRSNCDKFLDRSVAFVIDSTLLWSIGEVVNQLTTNHQVSQHDETLSLELEDHVLFLADFFEQTPSLAIVLAETNSALPGCMDLTLFRALEYLELRRVPPHFVSGLNTLRPKLRRLKCSRNLESLEEIFGVPYCAEMLPCVGNMLTRISSPLLTSVWPELREIDASYNRITYLDSKSVECTPVLEILNLSHNRLTAIDSGLSRILHTLTVLNLNYNQLTLLPPTPPNLKILLLSNNYIPTLVSRHPLPQNLEKLDLSQNVISDEKEIEPIRNLTQLRNFCLIGNPISYSDKYRKVVASHLCHNIIKLNFLLDMKQLTVSEIRSALDSFKRPMLASNPPTFLLSRSIPTNSGREDKCRQMDLRSLTQSIDSSSSSLRSARRKKAKFREIVTFDLKENPDEKSRPLSRSKFGIRDSTISSSSSSSIEEIPLPSSEAIKATNDALESIRGKYGENWLSRQAGQDVSNVLNIISSTVPRTYSSFSASLPVHMRDSGHSFYSAVSDSETSDSKNPQQDVQILTSEESIKTTEEVESHVSSDGLLFYTCHETTGSISSTSLQGSEFHQHFDLFRDDSGRAESFRVFENGNALQLLILNNFLYHVDSDNLILAKWDLRSLKSLKEDKRDAETESVHFSLSFDTVRKQLREKSVVMSLKDFKVFQDRTNIYIQTRTLQEFGEGFQCVKCQWEFSRGMAGTNVIHTNGKKGIPKEIPICPNPNCQSELLIPLKADLGDLPIPGISTPSPPRDKTMWEVPQKTSTPISGFFGGKSLPIDSGNRDSIIGPGIFKSSLFTLPTPKSSPTPSNTTNSTKSTNKKDAKSESDIETLSCDSSIEILPKASSGNDSGSDVAVILEEGIELDHQITGCDASEEQPLAATTKNLGIPMTDSTSSGSCTGSICTQYEKTITANSTGPSTKTTYQSTSRGPISTNTFSTHQPIKYNYDNYAQVDHRLILHCDLNLFKQSDEKLLSLIKVMVMTSTGCFVRIIIFSNKKVYFCKITGPESDKIESWLQNWKNISLSRLHRLDVLIGRHGVGLDFEGKYYALLFRDSARTSRFIEFFLGDICGEMQSPPLVQDFSQNQKALMSPTNPIAYFGILSHASCGTGHGSDKSFATSAIVVTNEELILVPDISWLVNRTTESVTVKYVRELSKLRQVESFEVNLKFVRIVFQLDSNTVLNWELAFETELEKNVFLKSLENLAKDALFVQLAEPRLL